MVELATALMVIQTISLTVGVIYYIITLQNSNKNQKHQLETRQANLFSQYHLYYQSKEFQSEFNEIMYKWEWKDYADFSIKYGTGSTNLNSYSSWIRIFQFYDGLGILCKKGLLDKQFVAEMMSVTLRIFWEKNREIIKEAREHHNEPTAMEMTEYLYEAIFGLDTT